ncbi:MAG TPA: dTDP-glucose 4,6-dehydratase, partial [Puia sp.]|nr:dTDP-glucose 4,6-dehydratase [Puia sp.]
EDAPNYVFEKGDITDAARVDDLFRQYQFDSVIHLAAESHVDRSIQDPLAFVKTNVMGTCVLLNTCRQHWAEQTEGKLFYHVSTDEVYGSLGPTGFFTETTAYDPRSPYSASKAASDHFVMAYHHTYGLPVVLSNCSNNYGSHHFPEKLIPLMINNIKNSKPLPVYGKGENVRDWLYVDDHARAIDTIFHKGRIGEKYNIGGFNEWKNIDIVYLLCRLMDKKLNRPEGTSAKLIRFVQDRPGHDMRYAIDATKLNTELGWKPSLQFEEGLEKTVDWYLTHEDWVNEVTSGAYQHYYEKQYQK